MTPAGRVESQSSSRNQSLYLAAAGMLTMATALGIDRFVYTPLLPLMAESLGLSTAQAGVIASANFLGYLLAALAAAKSGLPGSRRAWLVGTLTVSALSTAMTGLTSSFAELLIVRFVGGGAGAFAIVIAIALVVERLAAEGRTSLLVLHFAGAGLGIAFSAALVSWLHAQGWGWRLLWIAASVMSLSFTALVAVLVAHQSATRQAVSFQGASHARPGFWSLIVANALSSFGYVITATFLVAMVRRSPDLQDLEAWIWIVFGLAAAPSIAGWTWLASRMGVARALSLAYFVEGTGVAVSVLWSTPIGMLMAAVFVGGTIIANTSLGMMAARSLCSGDSRWPVAIMTAAFGAGQIAGPTFAGVLHDMLGSFLVPSIIAASGLLVGALLVGRLKGPGLVSQGLV